MRTVQELHEDEFFAYYKPGIPMDEMFPDMSFERGGIEILIDTGQAMQTMVNGEELILPSTTADDIRILIALGYAQTTELAELSKSDVSSVWVDFTRIRELVGPGIVKTDKAISRGYLGNSGGYYLDEITAEVRPKQLKSWHEYKINGVTGFFQLGDNPPSVLDLIRRQIMFHMATNSGQIYAYNLAKRLQRSRRDYAKLLKNQVEKLNNALMRDYEQTQDMLYIDDGIVKLRPIDF